MNRTAWLQDRRMQKFRDVLSRWERKELCARGWRDTGDVGPTVPALPAMLRGGWACRRLQSPRPSRRFLGRRSAGPPLGVPRREPPRRVGATASASVSGGRLPLKSGALTALRRKP